MFLAPRSWFYIAKTVNFAVWAFPSFFLHDFILFGIDMHQNRSISLFKTLFDHFHFHPLAALKWYPHLILCHSNATTLQWFFWLCILHFTQHLTSIWHLASNIWHLRFVICHLIFFISHLTYFYHLLYANFQRFNRCEKDLIFVGMIAAAMHSVLFVK